MKRFWHKCLTLIAVAAMTGTVNAQWDQQPEIGSYQSILARAGYGQNTTNASGVAWQKPATQPAQGTVQTPYQHAPAQVQHAQPQHAPSAHPVPMPQSGVVGSSSTGCNACPTGGVVMNRGNMIVDGGVVGGPVTTSGCATGVVGNAMGSNATYQGYTDYAAAGVGGAGCGAVYQPGSNLGRFLGNVGARGGNQANRVGSLFGVVLRRDYEDDVRLAYNGAGTEIFSTDIDQGSMSGLGASLTTRNCSGSGWQMVYWGVDDDQDISLAGPVFTDLDGLADLNHVPSGFTMFDIFNTGTDARFYRDTEINNFELNLLRNGGQYTTRSGRSANYELLGGLRLFQFDESFRYVVNNAAPYPLVNEYALQVQNLLVGLQLGGRTEVCLSNRLRMNCGVSAGLFNNRIDTRQRIIDETGYTPVLGSGPSAGRPFDYSDQKDDAAILTQLDLGLIYQFSSKMRANIGYRALGVSGVALAVDQIPADFTDAALLQRANSNGSLLLHGLYFGSEYCF